jgi:hypothetical protein
MGFRINGSVSAAVSGSAQGEVAFINQTKPGPNTMRIFGNGVLQATRASGGAVCQAA